MTIKPMPRKANGKSAVSKSTEGRLVRIETLLDTLLDTLQTLPQSPQCVEGIQKLDLRLSALQQKVDMEVEEYKWVKQNIEKLDTRVKQLEQKITYWLGAIAVVVPGAFVLIDLIKYGVFK